MSADVVVASACVSSGADAVRKDDPVAAAAQAEFVLGVDLGGTKLSVGLGDRDGRILSQRTEPTRHGHGAPVLDQIVSLCEDLAREAKINLDAIGHMVVGVPAAVDPGTGCVSLSPNLALREDVSLSDLIGSKLPFAVTVENDVNLAAFGEALSGAGQGLSSLAFVAFGTGVGMGLVLDGKLRRGAAGRAGEIGLLPVGQGSGGDRSTQRPHLFEDVVGTGAILQRFARPGETVADLFLRADQGDAEASAAIDDIAATAALGLAAVQTLVDPDITVVGGGIGSHPLFLARLKVHLATFLPFAARVEQSRFATRAGLVGAVLLAARALQGKLALAMG